MASLPPPSSQIFPEDVIELTTNGVTSYAIVTRCWADEQGPEAIAEAARLGIPFVPLAPGQLEVLHPTGLRTELSESSVTVVDRGFLNGDIIRLSPSSSSPSSSQTQAGIITSLTTSLLLSSVLDPSIIITDWTPSEDIIGYHLFTRGDHVVFENWVGLVEEVFECATVEVVGGGSRRICDMGGSFQIGATAQTILDDRITTFLASTNDTLSKVVDVRQICLAVNWLCVSQLLSEKEMEAASKERPKRIWKDLDRLGLVRSSADHLHSVGDKVVFRKNLPSPYSHLPQQPVFNVTRSRTTVTAIFQDGTSLSAPAPTFEHCINIDEEVDVFPGDIGLFHSDTNDSKRGKIGIVQSMDSRKRTVRLRYLSTDEIETVSSLEFDPHGPPPEVYGVRRGDWVMVTKGDNGRELPTVPRLGESETVMGTFPSMEELRLSLATIGMGAANDLGTSRAPVPLTGGALARINWYAEVLDLLLDGTVLVRYPSGTRATLPLEKLYHIDDGLTPEGEMGMEMGMGMDDGMESEQSWETDEEDEDDVLVRLDDEQRELEERGGDEDAEDQEMEDKTVRRSLRAFEKKREREKRSEKGWADEGMEVDGEGEGEGEKKKEKMDEIKEAVSMPKEVEEDDNWMRFKVLEEAPKDHHYSNESIQVPSKAFMSRVKKEYNVLASSLPPNILVRAYEDRADLLRCMIIGPLGTPFQNAPFIFDVFLPPTKFPVEPPNVFFHSWAGGTRISPNLYAEGKCCLSLLNTWHGDKSESWSAARSSILQVFISIQSLIMVEEPYYTEPGFEKQAATPEGQASSELYNERTFVLTRAFVKRACEYPPSGFVDEIKAYYFEGLPTTGPGALKSIVEQAKALLEESDAFHKKFEGQEEDEERKKQRSVVLPELRVVTEGAALSLRRTLQKLEELQSRT